MNYIVLDLEWNQGNEQVEKQRKDIPFEIIEIGAVKMAVRPDGDWEIPADREGMKGPGEGGKPLSGDAPVAESFPEYDTFHEVIRPQVYHEMHWATKDILHMEMEDLEGGRPFPEVLESFLAWCEKPVGRPATAPLLCGEALECGHVGYMFATWGPQDLTELQRNMRYYQLPALGNGPIPFYDVQKLFSLAFEDRKSRRNLEYAVDFLQIPKENAFHRALDDAYYTARILERIRDPHILQKVSFDIFWLPRDKEEEIHIVFDDYAKYISREFKDKAALLTDKEVASTRCYLCCKNLKRKVKWFTPNGKHYYSLSLCSEHGYMKGKIRVKKGEGEGVYAVKTLKLISEETAVELTRARERAGEIRRIKNRKKAKKSQ